jgi:hypothetical protein
MKQKPLTITRKKAQSLYDGMDAHGKEKLVTAFGKKAFALPVKKVDPKGPITERIGTYADVCKELKLHPTKSLPYPKAKSIKHQYLNQVFVVDNIFEVFNEGADLSFAKKDQKKWTPIIVWNESKACFVFVYSYYYYSDSNAGLGPRLYLPSEPISNYVGKQFIGELDKLARFNHAKK